MGVCTTAGNHFYTSIFYAGHIFILMAMVINYSPVWKELRKPHFDGKTEIHFQRKVKFS